MVVDFVRIDLMGASPLQLEPKISGEQIRRHLNEVIGMVHEVLPEYKFNHQLVLVSGKDCARDKINKRMVLLTVLL